MYISVLMPLRALKLSLHFVILLINVIIDDMVMLSFPVDIFLKLWAMPLKTIGGLYTGVMLSQPGLLNLIASSINNQYPASAPASASVLSSVLFPEVSSLCVATIALAPHRALNTSSI